jgi:flagellar basal-body rod protein FlgC
MAFLNSFDISGYGLSAQRFRVNLVSSNIANVNTTRTDEGGPYRKKSAVFKAFDFNKVLNERLSKENNLLNYEDPLDEYKSTLRDAKPKPAITSVLVDKVVRDDSKPKMKFEPNHPDANSDGYVAYPNINPAIEMADLIEATRAYQANVSAFQSAKDMANQAISMLSNS